MHGVCFDFTNNVSEFQKFSVSFNKMSVLNKLLEYYKKPTTQNVDTKGIKDEEKGESKKKMETVSKLEKKSSEPLFSEPLPSSEFFLKLFQGSQNYTHYF